MRAVSLCSGLEMNDVDDEEGRCRLMLDVKQLATCIMELLQLITLLLLSYKSLDQVKILQYSIHTTETIIQILLEQKMAAFHFICLLLAAVSTNGFHTSTRSRIKCHQSYQLKHLRPTSVLLASLQEERKQISSDKDKSDTQHQQQHISLEKLQGIDNKQYQSQTHLEHQTQINQKQSSSSQQTHLQQEKSYVLSVDEMNPILQWTNSKGKTKVLNLYGILNLFTIAVTMPFWLLAMEVIQRLGDTIEGFDENRAKFDYSGKIWCRTYLRLVDSYPEIAGDVSRLKDKEAGGYDGACLFVANHASFLDIAVLCTVLDPVFKFIAKDSLVKFPGVGKQLVGVSRDTCQYLSMLLAASALM